MTENAIIWPIWRLNMIFILWTNEDTRRTYKVFNIVKIFTWKDSVLKISLELSFWVHLPDPEILWKNPWCEQKALFFHLRNTYLPNLILQIMLPYVLSYHLLVLQMSDTSQWHFTFFLPKAYLKLYLVKACSIPFLT